MVSPDIVYRMPVRQTVRRAEGTGFLDTAFHLDETYGSLSARIARTGSKFNWGEDPPSRTRHFVSNIRVIDETDGILSLVSSLLLYRTRSDQSIGSILSCERHDRLRRAAGTLRLIERIVLLDHTVVQTSNLALIF
jgi:3-phenylpropionate/cinnamic acid dioxygenase small subunit